MFRFHKTLDVLTLFKDTKPESARVLNLLNEANTNAEADKKGSGASFELDVVEAPTVPTPSQLKSILEFVGKNHVGTIVRGAKSEREAAKMLEEDDDANTSQKVLRPLLVDWNNGRVVLGANEGEIMKLVKSLPK